MPEHLDEREWLEPDGQGGYAMGTVSGPASRRYHGLLCVAAQPPTARVMLVNAMGESIDGYALDSHHYPDTVFPDGATRLVSFSHVPWPTWRYEVADREVTRELVVLRNPTRTVVRWTSTRGLLVVTPLVSGRDIHALHHENQVLDPSCVERERSVEIAPYPEAIVGVRLSGGTFTRKADWYRHFVYPLERERGLDFEEDLFSPGTLQFDLSLGPATLVLEPVTNARASFDLSSLLEAEARRRPTDPLARAADQFVVRATPSGAPRTTVVAGYPWFTDWGRDTFISARGLGLALGRELDEALLLAWAPFLDAGMIPNRFPDAAPGQTSNAEYNAVDASLWFGLRCAQHLAKETSPDTRATLSRCIVEIFEGFLAGTRHNIHIDDDGLVHAAEQGLQLTWMDAKVDDWVVTPRAGKPVEVQALWVAMLETGYRVLQHDQPTVANEMMERAAWARSSFAARFWCESRGWMYDVIDGPMRDETLRPNQLYALGLVRPLIELDRAKRALDAVERELLVPVGLRSRARDASYHGTMVGDARARDSAYHEGTAWPFLLGIYADACQRVRGQVTPGLLDGVLAHLGGPGLGQLAEVFDGDAPHTPRGCPAQAWSIAEVLRVQAGAIAED